MRRFRTFITPLAILAASIAPNLATAQTVFFDDFDGNALLPHWSPPPASHWNYAVSNGILSVSNLLFPSNPKSPGNFVTLGEYGSYSPQTDFQIDARMGWGSSDSVTRFDLTVMINQGIVATMGYHGTGLSSPASIFATTGGTSTIAIPAPLPGSYDFRMTRIDGLYQFYFEGALFATLTSAYTGPVDGLRFFFSSPYPGSSGPFHIDYVRVQTIPSPPTSLALAVTLVAVSRRRRLGLG